jgi:hypothetical protein
MKISHCKTPEESISRFIYKIEAGKVFNRQGGYILLCKKKKNQ